MKHFPQHYDKTEDVNRKIFISIENFLVTVEKPNFSDIFNEIGLDNGVLSASVPRSAHTVQGTAVQMYGPSHIIWQTAPSDAGGRSTGAAPLILYHAGFAA